jgi:dethiobiotin synthetase
MKPEELSSYRFPCITRELSIRSKNNHIFSFFSGIQEQHFISKVFISGDRSSVGKSTICLSIIASLIQSGVHPSMLAYIKPATQCEAEQPISKFCSRVGVSYVSIGPIVFYKGFTRSFLRGETESSKELLRQAKLAVDKVSVGKKFVLIDGVGYPSVGSICNLSNVDVANALNVPVLLIGKSGVGDAVDSYNLNARLLIKIRNIIYIFLR